MKVSTPKIQYFLDLLSVLAIYFVLSIITDRIGPFLISVPHATELMYIAQLIIAIICLYSLWAAFNTLSQRPALCRMSLKYSAMLVVAQHFCLYDTNLDWFLPIILMVYAIRYKHLTR